MSGREQPNVKVRIDTIVLDGFSRSAPSESIRQAVIDAVTSRFQDRQFRRGAHSRSFAETTFHAQLAPSALATEIGQAIASAINEQID